jgi:hypothetical protein
MTGLTQLLRAQELWVLFGITYSKLDSELQLYLNNSGIYSGLQPQERCPKFVERFEAPILSFAGIAFLQSISKKYCCCSTNALTVFEITNGGGEDAVNLALAL